MEQVSSHTHTHYSTTTNILDVLVAILLLKCVYYGLLKFVTVETEMRDRHLKGAASRRRSALKPPEDLLFSKNPVVSFSAPLQASSPPHGAASTHILAHIETPPPLLHMVARPNLPEIKHTAGRLELVRVSPGRGRLRCWRSNHTRSGSLKKYLNTSVASKLCFRAFSD